VTVEVEIENHSGWRVDEPAAAAVLRSALAAEGVDSGEVGLEFVDERRIAELNGEHRGKPSATDVLSFPIDGRALLPEGVPRQLGDLVVCPAVASAEGTPIASPAAATTKTSRRTIQTTVPRCAPSAIRIPISLVRRATA